MVDSGLIDYWSRKWSPEKRQCEPDKGQNGRVIGLNDTQTAFYLAVLGLGLAGLVLGVERLILTVNMHRWTQNTITRYVNSTRGTSSNSRGVDIYLIFTHLPGESYRRRLGSLLLCLCGDFRAQINSLVCWFCTRVLGLVSVSDCSLCWLVADRAKRAYL